MILYDSINTFTTSTTNNSTSTDIGSASSTLPSVSDNKNSQQDSKKSKPKSAKKKDIKPIFDEQRYYKLLYQFLKRDLGLTPGSKILLCISGGIDSMAMLHIFAQVRLQFDPPFQVEVITFNHKLRPESDEEIQFVKEIASAYGFIVHVRERSESLRTDSGLQAFARNWRRKECLELIKNPTFLDNMSNQVSAESAYDTSMNKISGSSSDSSQSTNNNKTDIISSKKLPLLNLKPTNFYDHTTIAKVGPSRAYIATAHHADDALETVLLKIVRGVHISHMSGLQSVSDCGQFIKPLLPFSKSELIEYMMNKKLTWREDKSNESTKYKRNEIRLELIPLLEKLAGGIGPLRKRFQQISEQSDNLRQWLEIDAKTYMINYVKFRRIPSTFRYIKSHFSAELSELTSDGAFSSMPNLIKTEIIDAVCQILHSKAKGYDTTVLSNVSIRNSDDESADVKDEDSPTINNINNNNIHNSNFDGQSKRLFISYELLSLCCDICSQQFSPLYPSTRTITLSDGLTFTRTGTAIQIDLQVLTDSVVLSKEAMAVLHTRGIVTDKLLAQAKQINASSNNSSSSASSNSSASSSMSDVVGKDSIEKGKSLILTNKISKEISNLNSLDISDSEIWDINKWNSIDCVYVPTINLVINSISAPITPSDNTPQIHHSTDKQLENFINLDDAITVNLYNIPNNSKLRFRRIKNGDKFQPTWKQFPIKVVSFLRDYSNLPLHKRPQVVVIEMIHNNATRVISVPPFVSQEYSSLNQRDINNKNRRQHMTVQISNKFIPDTM